MSFHSEPRLSSLEPTSGLPDIGACPYRYVTRKGARVYPDFFKRLPVGTDMVILRAMMSEISKDVISANGQECVRAAMGFRPDRFSSVDYSAPVLEVVALRQIRAFLEKNDTVVIKGIDPEANALKTYLECEERCWKTNRMLSLRSYPKWDLPFSVDALIFSAQRKISKILGTAPRLADLQCRFGPGATVSCKRKTTARYKLSAEPGVGREGASSLRDLERIYPRWLGNVTIPVTPASLTFVPKTYKTHRPIEVQPTLSGFVQLGIGSLMKRRMYHHGIDLYDQSINQDRARIGSRSGLYATIDLSSASDTVSAGLVYELLPSDWFDLLWTWRVGAVSSRLFNRTLQLEKFSAMGNGYTFELESLLFHCITAAACELSGYLPDISVYGDDIVAPSGCAVNVMLALEGLGFKINSEKSFYEGNFRESCGTDWVNGQNVRPFYIKGGLTPARLVAFHNFLLKEGRYENLREWLKRYLSNAAPHGPSDDSDGHLHSDDYRPTPCKHGMEGYLHYDVVKSATKHVEPVVGDALFPTYTLENRSEIPGVQDPITSIFIRRKVTPLYGTAVAVSVEKRRIPREIKTPSDPYVVRGGERARTVRSWSRKRP